MNFEQQRDYLLSTLLSIDLLARSERLSNAAVIEITAHALKRLGVEPGDPLFEQELAEAVSAVKRHRPS